MSAAKMREEDDGESYAGAWTPRHTALFYVTKAAGPAIAGEQQGKGKMTKKIWDNFPSHSQDGTR